MPEWERDAPRRRRRRAVGPAGAQPTEQPDLSVLEAGMPEAAVPGSGVVGKPVPGAGLVGKPVPGAGVVGRPVAAVPDDDERLRREVPPHHGS